MTDIKKSRQESAEGKSKGRLKNAVWKVKNAFFGALFPRSVTCDVCGEEMSVKSRYCLCGECMSKLEVTGDHVCLACGVPMSDEADYCMRCQNVKSEFVRNRSPLVYDGTARDIIHRLKFGGKKYLAETLGAFMSDEYLKSRMECDIAVYVPMTEAEEKKRGFNQSELLAREVGARLNIPVLPALVKTRETATQKLLSGKERAQNLKGAFACVFEEVKGRRILLIDDVFTTGATASACAAALLKGGARDVSVLTAAVTKLKIPVESEDGTPAI